MSTEFFNDQWRIPSNENQNKISNYSMEFDGTNDYIDAGTGLGDSLGTYTGDASISLWFKADTTTSNEGLFTMTPFNGSDFGDLRINIHNNDLYFVSNGINNYKYTSFTDTTSWHHLVCIFKSGDITNSKIYLDGVDKTTTDVGTFPSSLSLTGLKTIIGAYRGTSNTFNGKINQVTFFDYALSASQVTQLGAEGYAFEFNGSNNYVDTSNITSLNSQSAFSTSFWTNPQGTLANVPVVLAGGISSTNRFYIQLLNSTTIRYVSSGSSGNIVDVTVPLILDGNWHHIATAHSGTSLDVYFDGVKINSSPLTITAVSANIGDNFTIGAYFTRASNFFNGELSNAQAFNSKLEDSEITTLYNNGKPLTNMSGFTSLQGWWKLDDTATFNSSTSVWTIPDNSSNSNNGTSNGMSASSLVASNINGELIANPMITSPKPIAYYQLGDQSAYNGANYLVPNNSLSDYVFNFDGTDFINCGNNSSLSFDRTDSFSFSAWINSSSSLFNGSIFSKFNNPTTTGYFMGMNSISNKLRFAFRKGTGGGSSQYNYVETSDVINTNQWSHVVATYNGNQDASGIVLYVNGVAVNTTIISNTLQSGSVLNNEPFRIGSNNGATFFNGQISNLAVFNSVLTGSQVATIYNNGTPEASISHSPVSWYKLNAADTFDGSNWTITDYGSGGNDGTSSGMTSANLVVSDLQQTSGYSPYALDFDGITNKLNLSSIDSTGNKTYSCWIYPTVSGNNGGILTLINSNSDTDFISIALWESEIHALVAVSSTSNNRKNTVQTISANQWYHIAVVKSTGSIDNIYINGANQTLTGSGGWNSASVTSQNQIANADFGSSFGFDGSISNVATWDVALTSTEITEVYNQGVPSNLNTFSGTAPTAWWQLGSNSSFNSSTWTCLDEIGTNNAVSGANMSNDDIVNGVGYSASGLGTSSIEIKGDAPYSTANGLSENMDVLDRTTDIPS